MRRDLEGDLKELMFEMRHESGFARAFVQGFTDGFVEGLQRAAIEIAGARGVAGPDVEQRIAAITNPDLLRALCASLGRAANVNDARAVLAAL